MTQLSFEKMPFKGGFAVDFCRGGHSDKRLGRIERNELLDGLFKRMRRNKNAVLEFQKFERPQMLSQNIAEQTVFFGNVKEDKSPFPVPALRLFEIYGASQKAQYFCLPLAFRGQNQFERSVGKPFFCKEFFIGESAQRAIEIPLVNFLPFRPQEAQSPIVLPGRVGKAQSDTAHKNQKYLFLHRSEFIHIPIVS